MRIPAKVLFPKGSRTAFREDPEQSERSAGISIIEKMFGYVKSNLFAAQRRKSALTAKEVRKKAAAALVPASALTKTEREALRIAFTEASTLHQFS